MYTKADLLKQLCLDIDMEEANTKSLVSNGELNENYFKVLIIYKKILNKYLSEILNLKKYDELLKNSKFKYVPNLKENYDIYQYTSNMEMDYFYVRNNLFIERLNNEQIDKLKHCYDNNQLTQDAYNIIKDTYKDVIKYYKDKPNEMNVPYGPFNPSFFAPNNSIVIGLYIDYFAENGLNDNEWKKNFFNQKLEVNNLIKQMQDEFSKSIDIPVTIIQYDENSIISLKKKSNFKRM